MAFSKSQAFLKRTTACTVDGLWNAIGQLLDSFQHSKCENDLTNSDYRQPDRDMH
jgi:hypothetical protein